MWPSMLITAFLFLVWDAFFTAWGIWGFNDRYILGQRVFGMPYEELAFFICIPYACLFTYHCFSIYLRERFFGEPFLLHYIVPAICVFFIAQGWGNYYTMSTATLLLILYLVHILIWKSKYLNIFLISYLILLIPFIITNGVLTGTGIEEEVVWYNDNHNLGFRILTIPIEDIFYGLLLILCSVTIYHKLKPAEQTEALRAS